jgi:hypothetical protein
VSLPVGGHGRDTAAGEAGLGLVVEPAVLAGADGGHLAAQLVAPAAHQPAV